jgi:hypothetical protein
MAGFIVLRHNIFRLEMHTRLKQPDCNAWLEADSFSGHDPRLRN